LAAACFRAGGLPEYSHQSIAQVRATRADFRFDSLSRPLKEPFHN
jgi:hypothetical protein